MLIQILVMNMQVQCILRAVIMWDAMQELVIWAYFRRRKKQELKNIVLEQQTDNLISHDKIVASVVKPIDEAIVALLRDGLENGKFDTSISSLGLKEGGVKLLFTDNQELLSMVGDENMAIIDDLKEKIVSGELIVPATEEEWNSFDYTY